MTFDSPFLTRLRATRTPSAAPEPVAAEVAQARPAARTRPDLATRAAMRGHCGTCRHFTPDPAEGRYMGRCALGWAAHEPWASTAEPVVIHEAAQCMTVSPQGRLSPRWALRAGVLPLDPPTPRDVP